MLNRSRHGSGRMFVMIMLAITTVLAVSLLAMYASRAGADEIGTRTAGTYDVLDADDEYVESLEITSRQDGTAPWDDDDADGDDSGDANGRVRSYDYVSYTLQLSSAPYAEGVYYRTGYIRYKLVLPCDASVAVFDTGAMSWMTSGAGTDYDWHIDTEEIGGRQCQALYCSMYKTYAPHAFPCLRQTANVQIQVKDAPDGTTIAPTFSAWMDHNETNGVCATHGKDEVATVTDDGVTVTSRQSLNVQSVIDSARIASSDADFSTGGDGAPNRDAGKVHGAFFNIGNIVELRNTGDQSRGLRGISVPDGADIEYDVTLTPHHITKSGIKGDAPDGTRVLLWKGGTNATDSGYGRGYTDATPVNDYCATVPYGDYESPKGTKTGTVTVTQSGNVLHVRIHGYSIDEGRYPTQVFASGDSASVYYDQRDYGKGALYTNRGVFASAYESVCVTYDASTLAEYGGGSLSLDVTVSNLMVGCVPANDAVSADNDSSASYALGGKGSFDNRVWFCPYYGLKASDMYGNADRQNNSPYDTAVVGQKAMVVWGYTGNETEADYHYAVDSLVKFDASVIEPLDESPRKYSPQGMNTVSDVVYAAKPDGTDWTGDKEKNEAKIGDLVYYKTLADLKASGKACVGLLVSQRKSNTSYGWHWMTGIAYPVRVRDDDALVGTVTSIVETSTYWSEDMISPKDAVPTFAEAHFGGTAVPTPTVTDYRRGDYVKSTYTDGVLTDTGNFNVGLGDSLYVMRYDIGVTKRIEQSDGTSEKATYSLDNGESVVDYAVTPTCSRKIHWNTDITISDTVPKGMEYDDDAVMGGTYVPSSTAGGHGFVVGGTSFPPTVTKNDDGTVTLTWTLTGFNLKNDLPTIHYSCSIDKVAAVNNQEYENAVTAESTDDRRSPDESKGNVARRTVKAVKLTSYSLSKVADRDQYELPDDIGWNLTWNNTSRNSSSDTVMLDMMPYDGDGFGSSYHGTYSVVSLTLSPSDGTSLSDYAVYYTEDVAYRGKTTKDVTEDDVIGSWTRADVLDDGTVPSLVGKSPVAWCAIGSLPANATLSANVRIATDGASVGDSYVNGSSMMRTVVSSRAAYLTRSVSGYAFVDAERNGYMDDVDKGLAGLTVTLFPKGDTSAPAMDAHGDDCVATTDADGHYRFDGVPDGEYDVRFSGGTIGDYGLVSVTKDGEPGYNKADGIVTSDDGKTESVTVTDATKRAVIGDRRDATSGVIYEREYSEIDAALFPTGELTVAKTDGSDPVSGATLVVSNAAGGEVDRWVTGSDGRHTLRLGKGSYTVTEDVVPDGYEKAPSISFSVDGTGQVLDADGNPVSAGEDGIVIEMVDKRKPPLPLTGMDGRAIMSYLVAAVLVVAASVMTARRHAGGSGDA